MKDLPEKIDSKFRFVLLASHRAEQMMRGAQPKEPADQRKLTRIAMHEIEEDQVAWDYGPEALPEEEEYEAEAPEGAALEVPMSTDEAS